MYHLRVIARKKVKTVDIFAPLFEVVAAGGF